MMFKWQEATDQNSFLLDVLERLIGAALVLTLLALVVALVTAGYTYAIQKRRRLHSGV